MSTLESIPEIIALDSRDSLIRIPGEQDVPVTPRIAKLIDSGPFRRLASISQLGLVSLVYPGATHSRFEHSLGVYRMALLFLKRLSTDARFRKRVSRRDAELLIVAALLHDIGHWPYCHPLEDMQLEEIPDHEELARQRIAQSEIPGILKNEFQIRLDDISDLVAGSVDGSGQAVLKSILSGPIDVDKMDYLYRDSLHAGVPYGMHYDRSRLIGSLCLDESGSRLAITSKGVTAAELMVFARYVMFREVYWHHTVRSATAMLQRGYYELRNAIDTRDLFQCDDAAFQGTMLAAAEGRPFEPLIAGLFGPQRNLFKRLAQFTVLENPVVFERLSRRPWPWLVRCADRLAHVINQHLGLGMQPTDLLIDAPPEGLEVQFQIDVRSRGPRYRPLEEVSPVVRTLAQEQFDNYVKRVRVFVNPRFSMLTNPDLTTGAGRPPIEQWLHSAIDDVDSDSG